MTCGTRGLRICTGAVLAAATSAPGLGPHLGLAPRSTQANKLLAVESAKNDGRRLLQTIKDKASAAKRREQQTFRMMFQ